MSDHHRPRGEPRCLVGAGVIAAAGPCCELCWEMDPGDADTSTLNLCCDPGEYTEIGIDHRRGLVWVDRSHGGRIVDAVHWAGARGPLLLRVFVDRGSVEVFSADGLVAQTELGLPADASIDVAVLARGGAWTRSVLTCWPLKP